MIYFGLGLLGIIVLMISRGHPQSVMAIVFCGMAAASGEREDKAKAEIAGKNVPVNFWGRVVDQDGKPLQGVRIVLAIRRWHLASALGIDATFPKSEVISDSAGRFQVLGGRGDNLSLETVEKEGYQVSPNLVRSFSYGETPGPFVADASNPVVIRMWKTLPKEPLKTVRISKMIPYDGTPVQINLLEGKLMEGNANDAHLTVRLERQPREIGVTNRIPFDWNATITISDGGLAYTQEEFPYLAPVEGYTNQIHVQMPRTLPDWSPLKQISFFVRNSMGTFYGLVKTEFRANYSGSKTGFTLEGTLNTNASRVLQP